MAKILKWWHQYGFVVTIVGYIFMMGTIWQSHKDAIASIQSGIDIIQEQHNKENIDHRVTILEQIASDNKDNFSEIKDTEKAIFQRLNQISDNHNQ